MSSDSKTPYDMEAECAALGACMISEVASLDVAAVVRRCDFFVEAHRLIFGGIERILADGGRVDMVTVASELRASGQLERVGGCGYLSTLIDGVPSAANARQYAERVKECSVLREVRSICYEMYGRAGAGGDARGVLDEIQRRLLAVSFDRVSGGKAEPIGETMRAVYEGLDSESSLIRVTLGIPAVDRLVFLSGGNLVVIGARPSVGKTSLALQMVLHNARRGVPCVLFSLEMSKVEVARRFLSMCTGLSVFRMRGDSMGELDAVRLARAASAFDKWPVYIDDCAALGLFELHVRARRLLLEHGVGLFVVDYLQLLDVGRHENRAQALAEATRSLKCLARELGVPVVVLSQLNRGAGDDVPRLHHLRDSGAIEADADVCLLLHRRELGRAASRIIIAKQRNGPTADLVSMFDRHRGMFFCEGQPEFEEIEAADERDSGGRR